MREKLLFIVTVIMIVLQCDIPVIVSDGEAVDSFPSIEHSPQASKIGGDLITTLPQFDSLSSDPWQLDFRGDDLSQLDLRSSIDNLLFCTFDDRTKWPSNEKLPEDFSIEEIVEYGKNPGLGLRELHAQGITGKGIGIGIIDQTLLTEHVEYADRLQFYEEIGVEHAQAAMHASAVTSIAAGKNVGVAPEAYIYCIGTSFVDRIGGSQGGWSFVNGARALWRLLKINEQLPKNNRIRVISMSIGWSEGELGYQQMHLACQEAKAKGILVVSSSIGREFGLFFHGLGRGPLDPPDSADSFTPGLWWAQSFFEGRLWDLSDHLLVPMDSRTIASPSGTEDYVFYRQGGWSWSIPWIAGLYALACQVDPEVTPDRFWETALRTGKTIEIERDGKKYSLGKIADPKSLVDALLVE